MKLWFGHGVVVAATGVLAALPAFAADPHDAAAHAADAAHESPPLFSVDPGLMIWTIVTFLVVLVVLRLPWSSGSRASRGRLRRRSR